MPYLRTKGWKVRFGSTAAEGAYMMCRGSDIRRGISSDCFCSDRPSEESSHRPDDDQTS